MLRFGLMLACACLLAWLALAAEAGAVTVTEFTSGMPANSGPYGITAGPDGNLWFTEFTGSRVGRITPSGAIRDWSTGNGISNNSKPRGIVAGPDGNLWFAEDGANKVAKLTPAAVPMATEYTMSNAASEPFGVAVGRGSLWFTQAAANRIAQVTPGGTIAENAGPTAGSVPTGMAFGADGNPWFTEKAGGRIGRFNFQTVDVTEFSTGITAGSEPFGITAGPDGNLWFAEQNHNAIGRITTAGVITEFTTGITSPTQWIAPGPDGNLWFTEYGGNQIGRITTAGVVTEYPLAAGSGPQQIVTGPDDNIWYAAYGHNGIGRLTLDPAATTGAASAIGGAIATLSGTVNPFGAQTSYAFQYGRSTAYGSTTDSRTRNPASGSAAVSLDAGGLQPNTLYHYRVVATSVAGTTYGSDRTFTSGSPGTPGGSGAGSPSQDRAAPLMQIRSRSLVMTSGGRVLISIACPLAETLGCKGSVKIETAAKLSAGTAAKKRRLLLGSARFQIGGGQARNVSVRLSRRGRALARAAHGVLVRTTVVASDTAGNSATKVKRLKLRAVKRVTS